MFSFLQFEVSFRVDLLLFVSHKFENANLRFFVFVSISTNFELFEFMQEREREVPAKEQNVNAHNDDLFQQFDFVQVVSGQSKIMVALDITGAEPFALSYV